LYPAGTVAGELDATVLAAGLPDAPDPDADDVAEAAGFAVTGALLHDVTATVIPITTGSARPTTRMRNFAAFP
jgi:hypothetical protein